MFFRSNVDLQLDQGDANAKLLDEKQKRLESNLIYFRFFLPFFLRVYSTRNVSDSRMQNWQISNLSTPSLSINEISNSSTLSYRRVAVQIRFVVNIEK